MYTGFILWLIGFPIFFEGYFSMILALLLSLIFVLEIFGRERVRKKIYCLL